MNARDPLDEYRAKRDFERTPEPPPQAVPQAEGLPRFVIHKHDARNLHYDLRLEIGGTLASWAVPRGPSADPDEKRLAVRTEDHPLEYLDFEGVIPKGSYGAGAILAWDRGVFHNLKPDRTLEAALAKGHLIVWLQGEKVQGGYHLVRNRGARARDERQESWFLIKMKDAAADPALDLVSELGSVISGKTIEQLYAGADLTPRPPSLRRKGGGGLGPPEVGGLGSKHQPEWISPMLASPVDRPFSHPDWLFERKLDGERCLIFREGKELRLLSRNRLLISRQYPELVAALLAQAVDDFVADGEIVALDENGLPSFERLQSRMHVQELEPWRLADYPVVLYLFDLLWAQGYDIREVPLEQRRRLLASAFDFEDPLRLTEAVRGDGEQAFHDACRDGWEGVIAKRADRPYRSTRSRDWLKVKCVAEQEFVVAGYTPGKGGRSGFGALLVGYYDAAGALHYAGKVGTGFDDATLAKLSAELKALARQDSPFAEKVPALIRKEASWVQPQLVASVGFSQWTGDGKLRHPRFRGLRRDKSPRDVVLETANT